MVLSRTFDADSHMRFQNLRGTCESPIYDVEAYN